MFDFVLIFDSAFLYPISFHWPLETQPYAIRFYCILIEKNAQNTTKRAQNLTCKEVTLQIDFIGIKVFLIIPGQS